jgi:hypothetical protein
MPVWLVEGSPTVYFFLAFVLVITLALWRRTRKRGFAIGAAVVVLLMVGVFVIDRLYESDGEQMCRKVREVTAAVTANDLDSAFRNVSESFNRGGMTKPQFRKFCDGVRKAGQVTEVVVWDLTPVDVNRPGRTGKVDFPFKARGSWGETLPNYSADVEFVLDPDGQWRVKTFEVYESRDKGRTPILIPGLGR